MLPNWNSREQQITQGPLLGKVRRTGKDARRGQNPVAGRALVAVGDRFGTSDPQLMKIKEE